MKYRVNDDNTVFTVRSKSLTKVLNRVLLVAEVLDEDDNGQKNATLAYFKDREGRHNISLNLESEDTPA